MLNSREYNDIKSWIEDFRKNDVTVEEEVENVRKIYLDEVILSNSSTSLFEKQMHSNNIDMLSKYYYWLTEESQENLTSSEIMSILNDVRTYYSSKLDEPKRYEIIGALSYAINLIADENKRHNYINKKFKKGDIINGKQCNRSGYDTCRKR